MTKFAAASAVVPALVLTLLVPSLVAGAAAAGETKSIEEATAAAEAAAATTTTKTKTSDVEIEIEAGNVRRHLLPDGEGTSAVVTDDGNGGGGGASNRTNIFGADFRSERHKTLCARMADEFGGVRSSSAEAVAADELGGGLRSSSAGGPLVAGLSKFSGVSSSPATCINGGADSYKCDRVDFLSSMTLNELNADIGISSPTGNDIWGWTSADGREFAIFGLNTGTAFVDITRPTDPVYLGGLASHDRKVNSWRDIKVYRNHAFIVSEASGHGMQVFDLTRLTRVTSPQRFGHDAHYDEFGNAHNIAMDEDSGYAYAVGTNTCSGGLHMINVQNPKRPTFAGCYGGRGYTHDVQCVVYTGPDRVHQGKQICFACNEDHVAIVDVTRKLEPDLISITTYDHSYTHQGWLTEDQRFFFFGDEGDELDGERTTTFVLDVTNLDSPTFKRRYTAGTRAVDHNQYIWGRYLFQANYDAGLRVLDVQDVQNVRQVGLFDLDKDDNDPEGRPVFNGAWSVYPFFASGSVIISGTSQGLFVTRPHVLAGVELESGMLFSETFRYAGVGLAAESRAVSRVLSPRTIKGSSGTYVGRVAVSGRKRRTVSVCPEFQIPQGMEELRLVVRIAQGNPTRGKTKIQAKLKFKNEETVKGKTWSLVGRDSKRYAEKTTVVKVKGRGVVDCVRLQLVNASQKKMPFYIDSIQIQQV